MKMLARDQVLSVRRQHAEAVFLLLAAGQCGSGYRGDERAWSNAGLWRGSQAAWGRAGYGRYVRLRSVTLLFIQVS